MVELFGNGLALCFDRLLDALYIALIFIIGYLWPLLTEIARSLVVDKLQCNFWINREARLNPRPVHGDDISTQRIINDLACTLLGVSDLAD